MVPPSPVGARAAAALEATNDAVLFLGTEWTVAYVNGAAERLLARPSAQIVGRRLWDEFPHAVEGPFWQAYHRAVETRAPVGFETYRQESDAWFEVRVFPDPDGLTVFLRDTSERHRTADLANGQAGVLEGMVRGTPLADTLEEITRLAERSLAGSVAALLLADESGRWLHLAAGARMPEEMADIARSLPVGPAGGVAGTAAQTGELFVVDALEDVRAQPFRETALRHGVRTAWAHPLRDRDGRVEGVLCCYRDRPGTPTALEHDRLELLAGLVVLALERDRSDRDLHDRALHDPLTRLPNRTLLLDRAAHALTAARRTGERVGMIFCDVDHFKWVNDSLGHSTGDRFLVAVAERLQSAARAADTVARLGGDEYVVLCEALHGEDELQEVAERILSAVGEPLDLDGTVVTPSMSAGVAVADPTREGPPEAEAETLLRDADLAMYAAKRAGDGRSHVFTGSLRRRQDRHQVLESDLRRAVEEGALTVHYQPQVSLAEGRVTGVEALVRWTSPELGAVPPAELLPLAEDSGLIVPVGRQVLRTACADLTAISTPSLLGGRPPLRLSVNLTARQLVDPGLISHIEAALVAGGLDGTRLCLEIPEAALMDHAPNLMDTLRKVRALGVGISIENFGTGFSSLRSLKRLPVTELKVGRSFVGGLGTDPEADAIVAAIIRLAATLQLDVVAEDVETCQQEQRLKALGCPCAQGDKYAAPMPLASLVDWIRETGS